MSLTHQQMFDMPPEDRSIRPLGFKRFGWSTTIRLVSYPMVYHPEYRIVLVLDRKNGDLRVLEGGSNIFKPFGEWAWKKRTNPADERMGVDWTIRKFPRHTSYAFSHPSPLTDQETFLIDSRWPSLNGLKEWGFPRAVRSALLNDISYIGLSLPSDPPEGMYDETPQEPHPKCAKCGRCCMLFVDQGDEGAMPSGVMTRQQWFEMFHVGRAGYGVQPLFDAHLIHEPGNERLKEEVRRCGLNPDSCPYLGEKGCIIPRERMPWRCKRYRCPEWRFGWI